jgi:hypothetical protein
VKILNQAALVALLAGLDFAVLTVSGLLFIAKIGEF